MAPGWVSAGIWRDLATQDSLASRDLGEPVYYRALDADEPLLRQTLAEAPLEETASQGSVLELPMPDGDSQQFEVELSPIMSSSMAAAYPTIKTYRVTGIDNPAISGRLDMTSSGFHAMLTTLSGTVFIDPDGEGNYRSYYKEAYALANEGAASEWECHTVDHTGGFTDLPTARLAQRLLSTNVRRTYKLAVATTGEYGSYYGSENGVVNSVVTTINRVNQIYGRDLAVQLQLVSVVAYLDADDDPFADSSQIISMLSKNQELLDYIVGLDNYDIGHLFGTTGGGLAYLSSACTDVRAQGYTGHPTPDIGDPFAIDFVAHEIGHQLSATHTFNGTTDSCGSDNRTASSAAEPGSGSTIMAYAGICGDENLQTNSDATFHAVNIDQINSFAFSGVGSNCGTLSSISNSLPTTIDAGSDVTIPAQTPFRLTGNISADPDGDSLSYQWDQIDVNGTATTEPSGSSPVGTDLGDNPLFRSFVPKSTATRYFPRLSSLITGTTDIGETLPTSDRTMNFRMTVRDGQSGVGDDDVQVTVDTSQGPFQVSGGVLNSATSLAGGTTQTLIWDVANTGTSCSTVTISLLSLDSGTSPTSYCDKDDVASLELMTGVTNSGTANVALPSVQIANARVMVSCDDNVFFAVSDSTFALNSPSTTIASDCKSIDGEPLEHGDVTTSPNLSDGSISLGGGSGGGALYLLPVVLLLGGLLSRMLGWRR
jgi:hypothetical protein